MSWELIRHGQEMPSCLAPAMTDLPSVFVAVYIILLFCPELHRAVLLIQCCQSTPSYQYVTVVMCIVFSKSRGIFESSSLIWSCSCWCVLRSPGPCQVEHWAFVSSHCLASWWHCLSQYRWWWVKPVSVFLLMAGWCFTTHISKPCLKKKNGVMVWNVCVEWLSAWGTGVWSSWNRWW